MTVGVLDYAALVLLAGAAGSAIRWIFRPVDGLGSPRAFPRISVTLLVVLGVLAAVPGLLRHREESRLTRTATQLVGAAASVHCQSLGGAFVDAGIESGYVRSTPDGGLERATTLKYEPCRDLAAYLRSDRSRPTFSQVQAVHVLTHEAMHMRQVRSEGLAECMAVQRDAVTAMLLGATHDQAVALARAYFRDDFPLLPDEYRAAECRSGGQLDEHLPDPPWPVPPG